MAPRFLQSLVPRREKRNGGGTLRALKSLTFLQILQFVTGWLAWTCDAFDFFCVSLSVNTLAADFDKEPGQITTAITLTLLFRSLGAVVFGILSDRYGRKWPLVANLAIVCSIEIGTSFVTTFTQFLAARALFGIAMGGIWGLAASTALENLPVELRGLGSGIVQQGYACGYLFASVINLTVVPHTSHSWLGGNNFRTTVTVNGVTKNVPDYATVQGILIGVVAAYLIVITILGPENHAAHFENAKTAFEEGAGADEMEEDDALEKPRSIRELDGKDDDEIA
ncbi:hypothetical protein PISMIDRAFT_22082 [Pisolithus microcarpus 441]|uniref:Major facilitator superfamily (MFS) profile domain-containing protein n=1 Tax=Pisolithus microcarpus 441 TaxID=765257 RepID=A0A0C9ZDK7_9AGAM|nr:hypothetical protein PISMIDRAFT_22082 [Pisolithus microcarpus 441]